MEYKNIKVRVRNMVSDRSQHPVPNQYEITVQEEGVETREYFQSYRSIIACQIYSHGERKVYLDETYWDYSRTTGKYRNQWLGETKKETEAKIKSGEYILADLN